ncbi:MAG: type II toxin-antitoxin system VapC family toxin [Roseiflexaceae bacterium]
MRQFIAEHSPFVSAVSYVEVLGYHKLLDEERIFPEAFFIAAPILALAQPVLDQAIKLRQLHKISLGDALIAGTALAHHLTLVTRNSADFTWIAGLTVLNPFESP